MKKDDMHEMKLMVGEIHTALFGPKSNPEDGVFAIAKGTAKRVDKLETQAKTIWAIIVSIPVLGAALVFLGVAPTPPDRGGIHQ